MIVKFLTDKKGIVSSKSIANIIHNQLRANNLSHLYAFHFREFPFKDLKSKVAEFEDSNDAVLVAGEEIKFDHIIKILMH